MDTIPPGNLHEITEEIPHPIDIRVDNNTRINGNLNSSETSILDMLDDHQESVHGRMEAKLDVV